MPPQRSTLHAYFAKKTDVTPMRNLTNIGDGTPKNGTVPRGQASNKATESSAAKAAIDASNKRKAAATPSDDGRLLELTKQPRILGAGEGADRRKAKMQELLGESSAQEQNLKYAFTCLLWSLYIACFDLPSLFCGPLPSS